LRERSAFWRFGGKHLGFWSIVIAIGALIAVPLGMLVLNSFREVGAGELGFSLSGLTPRNYVEAYSNPKTYAMLANSLWFAVGSMLLAITVGGVLAFISERTNLRFRQLIAPLVTVPLIMPSLVKALAWVFLLSPDIGLLNQWLKALGLPGFFDAYSVPTMIWVEGISMSTLAFLLIGATLRRMDPSLEEAAIGSGASVLKTQLRITLPLLLPGLAGVMLLLFIRGIEAFEVPLGLGMAAGIYVFSTNIFYTVHGTFPPEYGVGFAYAITLVLICVLALLFYQRQMRRQERYAVVMGKGYRPRRINLGRGRYLGWGFMAFYGTVAVLLPVLILVWGSLLPYYKQPSLEALDLITLKHYQRVLSERVFLMSIKNTFILGLTSSLAIMFLSVVSSWFIYRTNIAVRRLLDFVIFMPYAISGLVMALGFLVLFLAFPNPLYGTIWLIVIAYTVNYLPTGSRFTHAAVVQIHKELEEAAWASGANFWTTLRRIWVPLLLPALVNGGLFVFILSFKVMSIAAMLQGPKNIVLSVYLWDTWAGFGLGPAAALSVLLLIMLGSVTVIARRLGEVGMRGQEA
jgi:iron(III) transport system permease protein